MLEELKQLAKAAAERNAPEWAKSVTELAQALDISRETIYQWRKISGSPKCKGKMHNVTAWRLFIKKNSLGDKKDNDQDPDLKRRKLLAEVEQREIKVSVMRRDLIPITEVRERIGYHIGQTQMLMRNKLENELPPMLVNKSAVEMRKIIAAQLYEVFLLLSKAQYAPPKPGKK